ncbi:PRC-barrel domain-containing protein [Candidatus Falkowbacteria bacterium]|nr:PRC-barrel domain-containing protein [Candidatus Falkowbacteria bacterium]
MKISSSDLINLPVYTEGGDHLGRVLSFDVDASSGQVSHYYVRTGLIQGLWHEQLMIHQSQVVSVSKQKMIVEENIKKEKATGLVPTPATK